MDETVRKANAKVLFNPLDSPAAVKSSNQVAAEVHGLRQRLGIESGAESADAKRWGKAAGEVLERARTGTAEEAIAAKRFGDRKLDRATKVFPAVDLDGDGIPDQHRAAAAVDHAGTAIRGVDSGVAGTLGSLFHRKHGTGADSDAIDQDDQDESTS